MSAGTCTFCGGVVNPASDYQQVVGWERRRGQGGTNALRGREPQDKWACRWCVEKIAKGVSPGQDRLL